MVKIVEVKKDDFKQLHIDAHVAIFGTPPEDYKFDYALLMINGDDHPVHYYTVMEQTPYMAYISFGGALPDFRGKGESFDTMNKGIDYLSKKYSILGWSCKNTNGAMIKFGVQKGFRIVGIEYRDGCLNLEHRLGGG